LHKSRPGHNRAEIQKVVGDVSGKVAIIFDDMVDTGGSVAAAAEVLRENGAKKVFLAATHAVLSGEAKKKLEQAKFEEIIFTDSIEQDFGKMKNVKIISIANLIGQTILGVHESRSVSKLWETHK
jgi:ribose-phosphate pyrophosphokinase